MDWVLVRLIAIQRVFAVAVQVGVLVAGCLVVGRETAGVE